MTTIEPRLQAAIEAAMNLIRTTAGSVADRISDLLGTMSKTSTRTADRDLMLATQFELRRNMVSFQAVFKNVLHEKVMEELVPRDDVRRRQAATDWQSLSLVDDREVEERMVFGRIGQMISHECDAELRELATYMGTLMRAGQAVEDRNPLRAENIGTALYRAIESVTAQIEPRKLLLRELGQAMAIAMKECYADILRDLKARGVQPVNLMVRTMDGPGHHLAGLNSAYSVPRDEFNSTRGQGTAFGVYSGHGSGRELGANTGGDMVSGAGRGGGLQPARSPGAASATGQRAAAAQADAQLMNLLRRLTDLASRPGQLDVTPRSAFPGPVARDGGAARSSGGPFAPSAAGRPGGGLPAVDAPYQEELTGLMAVNLIRAHREELMQASTGKLDHLIIDVVGTLFDQILSDPRVPPQMARLIGRLQLPVLRVALADSSFFSSRRHPVRRFVNRIASLACAYDDFSDGPGKLFLDRVTALVSEIVEGDFDRVELYADKLAELEGFVDHQAETQVLQTGAASTLEGKESELRVQQRYMLQLQAALVPMSLPPYLRDFVAQVWSQALVLAARRDGSGSERYKRFKRAGRDLVMSVQPKGSPAMRQKFLLALPPLMKDLNEGVQLIGWPESARKEFFGKLLPAHAEALKQPALSELDHNMMAKQLEAIFNTPVPGVDALSVADTVGEVDNAVIEQRFTPEEARQVGLVAESAVDWSGSIDVDIDLTAPGQAGAERDTGPDTVSGMDAYSDISVSTSGADSTQNSSLPLGLDINLDDGSGEAPEPSRGPQLMDHIKLGFAYQMHLKDEWQKVRLNYVSPGRSFFVFTRGKKHQETISMTSRMLARMCETGRLRAVESAYLIERATHRARKQLAALKVPVTTR
jgi:hypothetical protein